MRVFVIVIGFVLIFGMNFLVRGVMMSIMRVIGVMSKLFWSIVFLKL